MNNLFFSSALFRLAVLCLLLILGGCDQPDPASKPSEALSDVLDDTALEHAGKHLDANYVCPMHPQISKNEPGSCPICGMDLVKKSPRPKSPGQPIISVDSAIQQAMGIRTATATLARLDSSVSTTARLAYDESRLQHIHPRADGWMENLLVRSEGDAVHKGQHLGDFYSPDILNAQVDFLIALGNPKSQSSIKLDKARNRLRLFGVPEGTIKRIEQRRKTQNTVPVYAPADGVVTQLTAREGMFVTTRDAMFTIADLSRIWVLADVYEQDVEHLQQGDPAEIMVDAYPGRKWMGKLAYIYPELDARTRTLPVRVVVDNPDGDLHPNMYARISIRTNQPSEVLSIPRDALIVTGKREAVVLALGEGKFQPTDVVSGQHQEDRVEIRQGLKAGDEVVVSGQFLIDSEASLQASFQRLSGE